MPVKTVRSLLVEVAHDEATAVDNAMLQEDVLSILDNKGYDVVSSEVVSVRNRVMLDKVVNNGTQAKEAQ